LNIKDTIVLFEIGSQAGLFCVYQVPCGVAAGYNIFAFQAITNNTK
jgi:hypothetical protein